MSLTQQPQLYDKNSRGCWLIEDPNELQQFINFDDSVWIQFYNSGLRKVIVAENQLTHADYKTLIEKIESLSYLAYTYSLPPISIESVSLQKLKKLKLDLKDQQIQSARRNFFRSLRPAILLSQTDQLNIENNFLPHSVFINQKTCTACDACVKVCPTQALKIESLGSSTKYIFLPENCDGCSLCESVCLSDSIQSTGFKKDIPRSLSITQNSCAHCGHIFHLNPLAPKRSHVDLSLCTVCQQYKHAKGNLRITE